MKRTLTGALLLAASLFSLAHAGELTLYEHARFGGREVTLRGPTPDLVALGFNDRASSMVVRSGRWEVCVDAGFGGACTIVEPGEYPTLERLNDQISSVREVGRGDNGRDRDHERDHERDHDRDRDHDRGGRGQRAMLDLFTSPGLRGNAAHIVRDMDDLSQIGLNDRAYSASVAGGTWQLCSDAGYRGVCQLFAPGDYPDLGRQLGGRLSSARLVDGGGARPRPDEGPPVLLFSGDDMRGRSVGLRRDARNLEELDFNDQAGSIVVNEGQWEFCVHADFGGRCVVFGPGRYPRLDGMNNQISSVRRLR